MRIKMMIALSLVAVSLTGCSSFQGQLGKTTEEFTDGHGRVCTTVKWGDSASIDCDFPGAK